MRILFWSERFWPTVGGVGISSSTLLPALRERGHEFAVITMKEYSDRPEEDEFKGIPVYRLPFWTAVAKGDVGLSIKLRRRVAEIKRKFAHDLLHVFFLGPSILFHFQTRNVCPAPLLVSMDSALPGQGTGKDSLVSRTFRAADWVTCVSSATLNKARRFMPEIVSHSSLIYQGRKPPGLMPAPLPSKAPTLLCLGRLAIEKGFDLALIAFASMFERHPHVRLVVAGDGPERPALEQQARKLGINDAVDFLGWVAPNKVSELINTSTIVVMPSRREGLPQVAMEAALMARPVVAARVGGVPEIVVHGQTGLLVGQEDSSALADAVEFLVAHPEKAAQMGQAARERVKKEFSWDHYMDAYEALYRKLISEKSC
ncbi:MAG: glycosyltransferase family 4 protein [Deltaproteobacteria bacterium]|nr:glycosyltransferase family 4 protein [Deltaproteobacteria bacterium]